MQDLAVASSPPLDILLETAKALFHVQDARLLAWPAHDDRPAPAAPATPPVAPDGGAHLLAALWEGRDAEPAGCLVVEDVAAGPAAAAAGAALGLTAGFLAGAPVGPPPLPAALLVLLDPRPRAFSPADRRSLAAFAAVATALFASEARAAEAERQAGLFRLLADHSTDTLVRGNRQGERLYISPGVRSLLGYEPAEMIGKKAADIMHPDDREAFGQVMADVRAGRVEQVTTEHRQRHRDGHWVWMEAHIRLTRDAGGEPDGYVVSVRDVMHRKATEARLQHAALHDPLTGLANRTLFRDRLHLEIARCRRTGAHFSLFWLDLDRFKEVNDRLGHEAGDMVLKAVAERLKAAVRDEDTVARIGGDEFVVLRAAHGAGEGAEVAAALARRLVATMDAPVDCAGVPVRIGLSVGVSLTEVEGLEADRLLRAADRALYRAKDGGRGRAVVST